MSFPRYPAYKASGVDWLGEVPEHWEVKKLRHLCDCLDGKRIPLNGEERSHRQGEIPYWGANGIVDYLNEWIFDEELVLLGEDGAPFLERDKTVSFLSSGKMWPNNHVHVLRPHCKNCAKFMVYCLNSVDYAQFITGSTRDKLNQSAMNCIAIPWPSANERAFVSGFLDHETAKIDALIAEQQRLIELLQEKRQAVISQAVTKGLNPDASMKDSGVEWLGEVPEHWKLLPVWMLFFLGRGRVISHQDIADNQGEYPVFSSQTEDDGEMGRINTFDFDGHYLTWTTDGANAGTVFKRAGRFNCTNVCGTLKKKPGSRIKLDFALMSLRLATSVFVRMDINPKLMNNVMASIKIPVPPLDEQLDIFQIVDQGCAGCETLEGEISNQLKLLQERRSALISAAVTGQIDVRGLVPEAVVT